MVAINPLVWDFILANARAFKAEVYGWLLGYYADNGEPTILGAYDCQKFVEQTLISAIPEPKEYHEIAVSLPNGIGVVGMYHSHPAGSNIFHSHIDDSTVIDYTRLAENFVSLVTNGTDVQCFMLVDKKSRKLKKIEPQLKLPKTPFCTQFRVNLNVHLPKNGSQIESHVITSQFADLFFNHWEKRRYILPGSKKIMDDKTRLSNIPEDPSNRANILEIDLGALQGEKETPKADCISVSEKVEVKVFHKNSETIANVDQKVQNAVLNQLNQRILKGCLDPNRKAWNLAPIFEISFWNIPLIIAFKDEEARKESEEFIKGMSKRMNYISLDRVQQNLLMREQVLQTIRDLERLASTYTIASQKEILAQLKNKFSRR